MSNEDFNTTLIKCTKSLKPFAVRLTRSADDAEDLLQEMAYRALKSRNKFVEDTNLTAWLFTVMKNIFINNYRRNKKIKDVIENNDYKNIQFVSESSNNDGESNTELAYIYSELDQLSNTYRKPFLMHFNGYKYGEIAKNLNLPIGTVKSRIYIAKKEMQKKFNRASITIN